MVPTPKQNSVRYFTDWVLPQLDTLIDETVEPIEVWTTLDPNMQRLGDQVINATTPGRRPGRAGRARPRRLGPGDDRRPRLCPLALQPRPPRRPASPAPRSSCSSISPRSRPATSPTTIVSDEPITINGWSPRNNSRSFAGQVHASPGLRPVDQHRLGPARPGSRLPDRRRHGAALRDHHAGRHPSVDGAGQLRGPADRHDPGLRRRSRRRAMRSSPTGSGGSPPPRAQILYQHQPDENRVLVAPWVAAQMTDLLQAAVLTGTGRGAQIGRPVAGKTGTTSSNKDGWFLGFSSGLTTGVWMGRDDNKAIPGPPGRPGAGAGLPRFHEPRRRQPAGGEFRDRGRRCPNGRSASRTRRPGSRRPTMADPRQSRRKRALREPIPAAAAAPGRRRARRRDQEERLDQDFIDRAIDRDRGAWSGWSATRRERERERRERAAARSGPRAAGRAPLRPLGRSGGVTGRGGAAIAAPASDPRRAGARPGDGNRGRGSYGPGGRPHGRRSPAAPSRARGSAASCSGSRRVAEQLPQRDSGSPTPTRVTLTPALAANSAVSAASMSRAWRRSQRSSRASRPSSGPPTTSRPSSSRGVRGRSGLQSIRCGRP